MTMENESNDNNEELSWDDRGNWTIVDQIIENAVLRRKERARKGKECLLDSWDRLLPEDDTQSRKIRDWWPYRIP